MELGIPVVMAVNMIDIVNKNGDKINVAKLAEKLGCPDVYKRQPYMKVSKKYWGSWTRWGCCMKRLRIRITKNIIIIIT